MRKATSCFTLLAVLALLCSLPLAAWAGGSPEDAVNTFFGSLKKGDMEGAAKVFSGAAMKTPPKEGSKKYKMMKLWGESYLGVETMKVDGDTAVGTLKMDGSKIAEVMMGPRKAMLAKITDPAEKATEVKRFKAAMESFSAKLSTLPVQLKKQGGVWKVQEIK